MQRLLLLSSLALVRASVFLAFEPENVASGEYPMYAKVKFQVPSGAAPVDMLAGDRIVLTDLNTAVSTPPGQTLAEGWTQFAMNAGTDKVWLDIVFSTQDFPFPTAAAPLIEDSLACVGSGVVDGTGRILTVTLASTTTLAAGFPAGLAPRVCRLKATYQYHMFVAQRYLSPNPAITQQSTFLSTTITIGVAAGAPVVFGPFNVAHPWTSTTAMQAISSLQLIELIPSTTIMGQQLTSAIVTFILGVPVFANGFISMEFDWNFLVQPPAGTTVTIPIGYNCGGIPNLCCSSSTVTVGNANLYWTRVTIQLAPPGCMLPKDKRISFTFPQTVLGVYPAFSNVAGNNRNSYNHVPNYRIWTSSETQPRNCNRFSEPVSPIQNAVAFYRPATPAAAGVTTGAVSWCSNAVGFSIIRAFTAVPSTTTVGVKPSITISFTLNTVNLPNVAPLRSINGVIISSLAGVFAYNQGSKAAPQLLTVRSPAACNGVSQFYTNPMASLILLLNPTSIVAGGIVAGSPADLCRQALISGAVVTVVIPEKAVQRNLPPSDIRFDIRLTDSIVEAAVGIAAGAGGAINFGSINLVDSATSLNNFGWRTTLACSDSLLGQFTSSLSNIPSQSVSDRCVLVNAMNQISPVSGGFFQCPVQGITVTWVKVAESALDLPLNWPSSTAPSGYPQVVSPAGSPAITILSFGWIIDSPMYAVVVVYPPTPQSLRDLGLSTALVANSCAYAFIIRMNRLTESCQVLGVANPWEVAIVQSTYPLLDIRYFGAVGNGALNTLTNGAWASSNGRTKATIPADGVIVGYQSCAVSPIPGTDDGSDDALFGLLALIAVPVLLCCCLLLLLWFLRPKREACPCVPEYPVQEMYWVNAQPCAPTFSVAQCGPSTTPVYLVQ